MIRGLLLKMLREVWVSTVLFGLALAAVMSLLSLILPQVQEGMDEVFAALPFVRTIIQSLLGTDVGLEINAQVLQSMVWVHPVLLTLIWAHEITFCTRIPVAEIDRGTIDLLLGLPVSRRAVYGCESLGWLVSGAIVIGMGVAGLLIATAMTGERLDMSWSAIGLVSLNLYAVYIAVGGVAYLVSSCSSHRGPAMAVIFGLVLASFLLNFLAQFWEPAKAAAFLGVLNYYQPAATLSTGNVPVKSIAALLAIGTATWVLGGEIFARRNICTV
jgi:ABC-type transport system involved in multi-copper enzyme maturation permease subunit